MKGLTLTTKEQSRIQVLNGVIEGKVTVAEAELGTDGQTDGFGNECEGHCGV